MHVSVFTKFVVSECGHCGIPIIAEGLDIGGASDVLRLHLAGHHECRKWYDELPTADQLQGALRGLEQGEGE